AWSIFKASDSAHDRSESAQPTTVTSDSATSRSRWIRAAPPQPAIPILSTEPPVIRSTRSEASCGELNRPLAPHFEPTRWASKPRALSQQYVRRTSRVYSPCQGPFLFSWEGLPPTLKSSTPAYNPRACPGSVSTRFSNPRLTILYGCKPPP